MCILIDEEDSSGSPGEVFNVLRNLRSYLDKILEMNQIDISNNSNEDEDKETFDKIESYLIGCVSVICHSIKNSSDIRLKNVTMINMNKQKLIK